jgi:quinol monooxygenase YgiN
MSRDETTVLIRYRALAGREAELRGELATLIATVVREEPDCTGIEMLIAEDDPAHLVLVERWSGREAYLGPHLRTPHLLAFRERAPLLVAGPPEITFWRTGASV